MVKIEGFQFGLSKFMAKNYCLITTFLIIAFVHIMQSSHQCFVKMEETQILLWLLYTNSSRWVSFHSIV